MGRWTLTGAGLLAALALATPAEANWRTDARRAAAYAAKRQGLVSFSLRANGRQFGYRRWSTDSSLSVVKAMLLVAYLRREEVRGRKLRAGERALLGPMIRRSDNHAASVIDSIVGNAGLSGLAARVHMRLFEPSQPIWGASRICAADQSRFFLRIDRYVPRRHRAYAMRLLATIVRAQRWGIARVPHPGWKLYFKGGWGSGTGAAEHQVALLRSGRERVALAILTRGSPSAAYARETQRGVAARLLRGLRPKREVWRRRSKRGQASVPDPASPLSRRSSSST
jgi:hypothetical protein